jgi:aminoglycoside phosphotransferase (APT) family kinase protein
VFYAKTDCPLADDSLRALRSTPDAELGLTHDRLARACQHALGEPPTTLRALDSQGTFHRLYLIEARNQERYVLRASVPDATFCAGALRTETVVSRYAANHGIPVAEVVAVDCTREHSPFDYALLRWVPGRNLGAFDHDDALLEPPLRRLAEVVARLHSLRLSGFGPVELPAGLDTTQPCGRYQRFSEYLWENLPAHVRACVDLELLPRASAERVLTLFNRERDRLDACAPALLHGDLGNHNVMTDGSNIVALLDWEDCLIGDPIYDVAFWATFHPTRRHGTLIDGYRTASSLPADFGVRFWLYFLRVALAKTVHRHRFGYTDRPGREPASRRIQLALENLHEVD